LNEPFRAAPNVLSTVQPEMGRDQGIPVRLQVYLARAGAASRRSCEELIAAGRVTVNGAAVTVPGTKVAPGDDVRLDGKQLGAEKLVYLALNKPPKYICSSSDPQGRRLALELIPPGIAGRLYSVGRLDYLSSGLIFFTNDGEFTAKLSHPRSGIEKEYLVESTVPVPDSFAGEFRAGLVVDGERYQAKEVEKTGRNTLRIVLVEGKNREIRKVFSHFHLHPSFLRRVRIGTVRLGNLAEGAVRSLAAAERESLLAGSSAEHRNSGETRAGECERGKTW
jgi:23S rRNA pseudouridine2605 synthase